MYGRAAGTESGAAVAWPDAPEDSNQFVDELVSKLLEAEEESDFFAARTRPPLAQRTRDPSLTAPSQTSRTPLQTLNGFNNTQVGAGSLSKIG